MADFYSVYSHGFLREPLRLPAQQGRLPGPPRLGGQDAGAWPNPTPEEDRREYRLTAIKRWLKVFLVRFIKTSQFKRSCLPNAPKVGSGGSLSPRSRLAGTQGRRGRGLA
jgi:hypothetical protein